MAASQLISLGLIPSRKQATRSPTRYLDAVEGQSRGKYSARGLNNLHHTLRGYRHLGEVLEEFTQVFVLSQFTQHDPSTLLELSSDYRTVGVLRGDEIVWYWDRLAFGL